MTFKSAGRLVVAHPAAAAWILAAAVGLGMVIKEGWSEWQRYREYRDRPPESGAGVIAAETDESRKAERETVEATLSDAAAVRVGRRTSRTTTLVPTGEAAREVERDTGADITGDHTADGQTAEEIAADRAAGGKRGKDLQARHPADQTQEWLGTFGFDPTGRREAKIHVLKNPATGVVSPVVVLSDLKRVLWLHRLRLAGKVRLDDAGGWAPTADDWRAEVEYTPVAFALGRHKSVYVGLNVSAQHERRSLVPGGVEATSYWVGLSVECERPWKLDGCGR